jgi:hypothetical protein
MPEALYDERFETPAAARRTRWLPRPESPDPSPPLRACRFEPANLSFMSRIARRPIGERQLEPLPQASSDGLAAGESERRTPEAPPDVVEPGWKTGALDSASSETGYSSRSAACLAESGAPGDRHSENPNLGSFVSFRSGTLRLVSECSTVGHGHRTRTSRTRRRTRIGLLGRPPRSGKRRPSDDDDPRTRPNDGRHHPHGGKVVPRRTGGILAHGSAWCPQNPLRPVLDGDHRAARVPQEDARFFP